MNSDAIQLIGLGIILLAEQYMIAPWQFPFFAKMWNFLANLFALLSSKFAIASITARDNYNLVVGSD